MPEDGNILYGGSADQLDKAISVMSENFSFALVRDIRRPAPWDADSKLAALPLPRTTKHESAMFPGITPNSPAPAGVAPFR